MKIFAHPKIYLSEKTEASKLRERGGGLIACQDGLRHLFREELSMLKGAFFYFWGVWSLNPYRDGLGHLCSENGSSIRYFPLLTRYLRLARILCGTYIPSKRWFDKVAQIGPEKSAPECPFECGGGGAKAKRAMPKCLRVNLSGASLKQFYIRTATQNFAQTRKGKNTAGKDFRIFRESA